MEGGITYCCTAVGPGLIKDKIKYQIYPNNKQTGYAEQRDVHVELRPPRDPGQPNHMVCDARSHHRLQRPGLCHSQSGGNFLGPRGPLVLPLMDLPVCSSACAKNLITYR